MRPRTGVLLLLALLPLALPSGGSGAARTYEILYRARIVPSERVVRVAVSLGDGASRLRWVRFRIDPQRHVSFRGDGQITQGGDLITWRPPPEGGTLRYVFRVDHLRDGKSYDARFAETWALFRGDDLVPHAWVRAVRGAESRARLRFHLPSGWRVTTPYASTGNGDFAIRTSGPHFDRPRGWILAGKLNVIRETVAGTHVTIASPRSQDLRRLDILALLNWTLPALAGVIPEWMPERLLIIGADDPMWRGGLSGPASVYLHSDRPLVADDGTSPLLHELMHSVLGIWPGKDGDWIVEGLAELYSLELLARSRTISEERYRLALERVAERGRASPSLLEQPVNGAAQARAVSVLHALDQRIRKTTNGQRSLDDVVRALARRGGAVTTPGFQRLVSEVAGADLEVFFRRHVGALGG